MLISVCHVFGSCLGDHSDADGYTVCVEQSYAHAEDLWPSSGSEEPNCAGYWMR